MIYAREVTIPEDSQVYIEEAKFKIDKIILGERKLISDLEEWNNEDFCLRAVKLNSDAFQHVHNQTEQICLEAINKNMHALEYVKNQTDQLCLAVVRQNGRALKYVKNQTDEICLAAV